MNELSAYIKSWTDTQGMRIINEVLDKKTHLRQIVKNMNVIGLIFTRMKIKLQICLATPNRVVFSVKRKFKIIWFVQNIHG